MSLSVVKLEYSYGRKLALEIEFAISMMILPLPPPRPPFYPPLLTYYIPVLFLSTPLSHVLPPSFLFLLSCPHPLSHSVFLSFSIPAHHSLLPARETVLSA